MAQMHVARKITFWWFWCDLGWWRRPRGDGCEASCGWTP